MRFRWLGVLVCAAMLVACGDDDSDFVVRPSGNSSSSIKNVTPQSSDSETSVFSSSSVTLATPCKTETEDNCEYGELVDDRDGQVYRTVKIGDQWWMAENLNYETDVNYCYNDDTTNCTKYGRFYAWWTALTACPNGWHLPDTAEWNKLFTAVGDSSIVGLKLKSSSGWVEYEGKIGNGTDDFGFSAIPTGYRYSNGDYYGEGSSAYFQCSTNANYNAYYMSVYSGLSEAILFTDRKAISYSIRCVKDEPGPLE